MDHTEITHGFSRTRTLSFKHATLLISAWIIVGASLTFSRITHPAFGVQGDLPLHYHITRSFERGFSEGAIFPRWAALLDGGRGDALFTFYPPLSYMLSAALMKLLGVDAMASLKAVSLLALIIAQATSYTFARIFFNRRPSLICSLIYVLLPAYPLIALHRAFIANAVALSLVPLSLLGAHLLLDGERRARGLAIFALSFSAIILTHSITTYLCSVSIGLMALIYLPNYGWRGIGRVAGAGVLTLALTAFFLWPQQVESGWIQIGLQTVQQDYRNYFLFAHSPDGSRYRQSWADVNHTASLITLAQTLMALLLGLIGLIGPYGAQNPMRPMRLMSLTRQKIQSTQKTPSRMIAAFWFGLALTALGLLISLPISEALWRYLPGLKFVQFPWRFQPLVALGCGLLAATVIDMWPILNPKWRMRILAFLTWVVIFSAVFTFMLARLDEPGVTRAQVSELFIAPGAAPITLAEGQDLQNKDDLKYIYYAANQIYFRPPGSDFNLYPPASLPGGISIVSGHGSVVSQKLTMERREFLIDNKEPVRARIETYHYPHWVARLDGREIGINVEPGSGLILVEIPAGAHRLTLDFEVRQASQRIARSISFMAWGVFLIWTITRAIKPLRRKRTLTQ